MRRKAAPSSQAKAIPKLVSARSLPIWILLATALLLLVMLNRGHHHKRPTMTLTAQTTHGSLFTAIRGQWSHERSITPAETSDRPAWAMGLDPDKAQVVEGKLVQVLSHDRVVYNIDPRLQQIAKNLLRRFDVPYGGIVVMKAHTGKVLAMAGYSSADEHLGTMDLCLKPWAPTASVFKLITTAALLSENRTRPYTRVCYHGGAHRLSKRHILDQPKADNECDTLAGALAKSINAIIAKLALKHLDRPTLLRYANAFGFNQHLNVTLPLALSPAAIPEDPIARAKVAAGFWHVNLSVLHGAMIAQTLANRGVMLQPRFVAQVTQDGKPLALSAPWKRPVVTEFVAALMGKMMTMTTTVGTARLAFYTRRGQSYLPWGRVAGKTGSLTRPEPYVDYSWFVGFAPADKPEIAFAVLLGNPKRWRIKAASMARILLQSYGRLHPRQTKTTKPVRRRYQDVSSRPIQYNRPVPHHARKGKRSAARGRITPQSAANTKTWSRMKRPGSRRPVTHSRTHRFTRRSVRRSTRPTIRRPGRRGTVRITRRPVRRGMHRPIRQRRVSRARR